MSNSRTFIIDRATCWVMNRDGVGAEGKCCVSGPQIVRVETYEGEEWLLLTT